ncbi:hypothetical protein BpHYR1_014573 [Brachionus plicatilis]|uniref:Uncharacterized protein n=1 Tax=Brachionus plicatilis TaxID=10195 RepID=A0A3M7RIG2_BRAPC|nr:hypothetical protein BpHYR1_014573 [Brachionus plicatilis]
MNLNEYRHIIASQIKFGIQTLLSLLNTVRVFFVSFKNSSSIPTIRISGAVTIKLGNPNDICINFDTVLSHEHLFFLEKSLYTKCGTFEIYIPDHGFFTHLRKMGRGSSAFRFPFSAFRFPLSVFRFPLFSDNRFLCADKWKKNYLSPFLRNKK